MASPKPTISHLDLLTAQEQQLFDRISEVARANGTYPMDAYLFVQAGVIFAIRSIRDRRTVENPDGPQPESSHISGAQVCIGIRDLAWQHWGAMASSVLQSWSIHETLDFGRIVFALIEAGVLSKQESDTLDDFRNIYSIHEIDTGYRVPTTLVTAEHTGKLLPKVTAKTFTQLKSHKNKTVH
jgi:uncharacterized repeat protein (TIGR04138 family)